MYGLIATFDEYTEMQIKNIWQELKEREISSYAYEVENRTPHITLASYSNLDTADFVRQMAIFYSDRQMIDFTFSTIGSFLNSGTLFFQPTVTNELLTLHSRHHQYFKKYNNDSDSLYLPNNWIPHCTIANRLSSDKLVEAFEYCSKSTDSIVGKITEIALIEVSDKRKMPIIYSKKLENITMV